jgi:hypothetical protein
LCVGVRLLILFGECANGGSGVGVVGVVGAGVSICVVSIVSRFVW